MKPPSESFIYEIVNCYRRMTIFASDCESHFPIVRLMRLRNKVVGRGKRHRPVEPVKH